MEKFTIKVTETGVVVTGEKGDRLEFSAVEALMLLDILKVERSSRPMAPLEARSDLIISGDRQCYGQL